MARFGGSHRMLRTTRVRVSLHPAVGCPSLSHYREANRICIEAILPQVVGENYLNINFCDIYDRCL